MTADWRDRLVAAALFGGAGGLFWLMWSAGPGLESYGAAAAASAVAGAAVGAGAAPRLVAGAARSAGATQGLVAGLAVMPVVYVLSVFLFALQALFWPSEGASEVAGVVLVFLVGLMYGLLFLPAALLVGAGAGLLFYAYARRRLRRGERGA